MTAPQRQVNGLPDLIGQPSTCYWHISHGIAKLPKRGGTFVVQGGTNASKTYSIMQKLLVYALTYPRLWITVAGVTITHMENGGPLADLESILGNAPVAYGQLQDVNKSKRLYTFKNGSYIKFDVFPIVGKAKGPKRDILFVNEADRMPKEIFDLLADRTGRTEQPVSLVIADFNPTERFHLHDLWDRARAEQDHTVGFCRVNYQHNEFCPPETVARILKWKERDPERYKVYGEGKLGRLDGLVFPNIITSDIPEHAELLGYGMDFGYTNDPTTLVALWRLGESVWADELLYQTGMQSGDIATFLKAHCVKGKPIWCDKDPRLIDEINARGLNIRGADKGAGSIRFGISLMLEWQLNITPRSGNLGREVRAYFWPKDKFGQPITDPDAEPDAYRGDHAIDAWRYIMRMVLAKSASGKPGAAYSPPLPFNPNN